MSAEAGRQPAAACPRPLSDARCRAATHASPAASSRRQGRDRATVLAGLVAIARPDHWFKNIFMLPGAALALVLAKRALPEAIGCLLLALVSTCLIASANYTINEWLDAESDRHHPIKKHRPSVAAQLTAPVVHAQWALPSTCHG
jgi:4-hydroxybenzoate polyprenyltransferase